MVNWAHKVTHEWHASKTLNDMNIKLKSMTNLIMRHKRNPALSS